MDLDGKSAIDKTVIVIEPTPFPDIKHSTADGPVELLSDDLIKIRCSLDAAEEQVNGDYWLFVRTPKGDTYYWYRRDILTPYEWSPKEVPIHQGSLEDMSPTTLIEMQAFGLPEGGVGTYVFFFGVDTTQDAKLAWPDFYYDSITITFSAAGPCAGSAKAFTIDK